MENKKSTAKKAMKNVSGANNYS